MPAGYSDGMKNQSILISAICSTIVFAPQVSAASTKAQRTNTVFNMARQLEQAKPLTLAKIERITGHRLQKSSEVGYSTAENTNKLLREVDVTTDPNLPATKQITSVWLCLPAEGLGITRREVAASFGKWNKQSARKNYDDDTQSRFGYKSITELEYKRKNGWLSFDFDDDTAKQLRIIEIVNKQ
jgi:hypothetical protein